MNYVLSAATQVRFTVRRRSTGRRVGKRCVKPTSKNRSRHKCVRLTVRGGFTRAGKAGANAFHFTGRLGGKALPPADYRLFAKPGTKRAAFRIKR